MKIYFKQAGAPISELDIPVDVPLIESLGEVAIHSLYYKPADSSKSIQLDVWSSPSELGLSEGSSIIVVPTDRGAAGALPLNALYNHESELAHYLRQEQAGIQAAFLYTPADEIIDQFMGYHLITEVVGLSGNCIVYAPIKNIYDDNERSFRDWWEGEYKNLDFLSALNRITSLYCSNPTNVYLIARDLRLKPADLPGLVFFDTSLKDIVHVKIVNSESFPKLLNCLRELFSFVQQVESEPRDQRMKRLRKLIADFEKRNQPRVSSFPVKLEQVISLAIVAAELFFKHLFSSAS